MTKIKICGLFREQDIDYVNAAAPDYAGFVFASSRRQVTPAQAAALRSRLRADITPVGVFVDAPVEQIAALYHAGVIALAQLHGGEDAAYIAALKRLCPAPVIKAVRLDSRNAAVSDTSAAAAIKKHLAMEQADFLLFDNGEGGTGRAFDWELLTALAITKPYFLAGGVNADNIAAALALAPFAVDVSSGAETGRVKDGEKILALVAKVRAWGKRGGVVKE
jgi:phosphoribosylanthranilate isomerase